jgi:spore coat polysaccharide biosynthesis protein SpsF
MPLCTVATIEARMTSTRLRGKVLAQAAGVPMLELMIERLRFVPELDQIVIATTVNAPDDPIEALGGRLGVGVWRGSETDVLSRVLDAAVAYEAETIVELTGDCPLIDPAIVSRVIRAYRQQTVDYVSNTLERTYPDGMDTQVFATAVLADVASRTDDSIDREHVSLYIYRHPEIYSLANVAAPPQETRPQLRLTLDTREDLMMIRALFEALRPARPDFALADMLAFLDANPQIAAINAQVEAKHV